MPSRRSGGRTFSDPAITAALAVRALFRLALRQAEDLIASILALPGLPLPVLDHTTLSRRGRALQLHHRGDAAWERATGYGRRNAAAATSSRLRGVVGGVLRSHSLEAQRVELVIATRAPNRMAELGMPRARCVV